MQFSECYACHAQVSPGSAECGACGAPQTRTGFAVFEATSALKTRIERLKVVAAAALLVGFGFGVAAHAAIVKPPAEVAAVDERQLTIDEVNDLFRSAINNAFQSRGAPLDVIAWTQAQDGIILEIRAPTRENPAVFWQAISQADREAAMQYIAMSYTAVLASEGYPPRISEDGHPAIALKYYGHAPILAARVKDGRVIVNPSPFDAMLPPPASEAAVPGSPSR